jgi:hypothetical protein
MMPYPYVELADKKLSVMQALCRLSQKLLRMSLRNRRPNWIPHAHATPLHVSRRMFTYLSWPTTTYAQK